MKSERTIVLQCLWSIAPGNSAICRVVATTRDGVTEVQMPDYAETRQVAQNHDAFRALVSVLSASEMMGVAWSALRGSDVRVSGIDGWRAQFALFCWARPDLAVDDPLDIPGPARAFTSLSDSQLEALVSEVGDLLSPTFERDVVTLLADIGELCGDDAPDEGLTVFLKRHNLQLCTDWWSGLRVAVAKEMALLRRQEEERDRIDRAEHERQQQLLRPFLEYARAGQWSRLSGSNAVPIETAKLIAVARYARTWFAHHGAMPTGVHHVPLSLRNLWRNAPDFLQVEWRKSSYSL